MLVDTDKMSYLSHQWKQKPIMSYRKVCECTGCVVILKCRFTLHRYILCTVYMYDKYM